MRQLAHTRRPGARKKVRPVKTLSAATWAQLTLAIRQLAQATG